MAHRPANSARPDALRLTPARQWRNRVLRKRLLDRQRARLLRSLRLRAAGRAWLAARERGNG